MTLTIIKASHYTAFRSKLWSINRLEMDDMKNQSVLQVDVGFDAKRLRKVREHFGLSQSQMAENLGAPKSTYVGWELETAVPSVALYDGLADHFGSNALHFVMGLIHDLDANLGHIDKAAGRALAPEVESCLKRAVTYFDAGDVFELTAALLELPEAKRLERLKGVEVGLKHATRNGNPR